MRHGLKRDRDTAVHELYCLLKIFQLVLMMTTSYILYKFYYNCRENVVSQLLFQLHVVLMAVPPKQTYP